MSRPSAVAFRLAELIPPSLLRRMIRPHTGLVGVNYHMVSDDLLPHVRHVMPYKSISAFTQDLELLSEMMQVLAYGDLADHIGQPVRGHCSALLTFDDGYAQCATTIAPLLRERHLPATFFITSHAVDNRLLLYPNRVSLCIDRLLAMADDEEQWSDLCRDLGRALPDRFETARDLASGLRTAQAGDHAFIDAVGDALSLDWSEFLATAAPFLTKEQVLDLNASGFTIGAHGLTHTQLGTIEDRASVEAEIVESCAFVRELTGQDEVPFAFPFSGDGVDRDLLISVRAKYRFVGRYFDTRGLARDCPSIINRVPGDGGRGQPGRGTVRESIDIAYRDEARARLLRLRQRVRR